MDYAARLHEVYLFTTVLGVGITMVDMLGLLGHHGTADNHGDAGEAAPPGDHTEGHMPLLAVLRYLRTLVYFALGFGPLGLAAQATGASALGSLAWAVPGGLVTAWLARLFWRWQQHDVDSTVQQHELLLERARVIVPLSSTTMGRIRLRLGQTVIERYALAEDEWETLQTDEVVEIVRVTDECVYVRRAPGQLYLDA